MNQLIAFLLDHAMLDFSGDLSLDMVKDFLRNDDSPEARALLTKLVQDGGWRTWSSPWRTACRRACAPA